MNNLAKLAFAVGLAIAAGVLNFVYLRSRAQPTFYLALANTSVKAGQSLPTDDAMYKQLPIPGNVTDPEKTFIRWDDRAIVYGLRAKRDLASGDPIFQGDLSQAVPRYEMLGPFKLLSVGEHLTGAVDTERSSSGASAITVEPIFAQGSTDKSGDPASQEYDDTTSRLLEIIDEQRRRGDRAPSHLRIVAIESVKEPTSGDAVQVSKRDPNGSDAREVLRTTRRAIIVPIDRVASIPKVLEVGTQIGFVVPAYP